MMSKLINWFTYRWPFKPVIKWSLEEEIPGGDTFWYSFGAATLFVFVIQVVTGIWQLFYYVPTVDYAYQSVSYLRYQVPFGWFIHGLHYWGSNAFIVMVSIHLLRVFIWGAYKSPRQLTWLVGVFLLILVLAMSFTGALLPWDELGYWAAEVGTSIAGTFPIIGFFIKEFMRGGAAMNQMTLSRFFIAHVAILPGILGALIVFHVVAFRQFQSVGPWNEKKRKKTGYFWPQQVLKDLIIISILFVLMVCLSAFWPAQVSGPADALDDSIMPKPEWQFLFLYQFLKLFKGRWEPVGTTGVPLVLFLILFLLPFYDRNKKRNPLDRPFAMLGCFALIVWLFVYTIMGYYSNPGAGITAQVTVSSQASASVKTGADLFSSQGCIACHKVNGQGGNIGPNLSNIGSQGLSDQWLITQIRDPKAHDPSTAMPSFSSLSDQQVKNLVDFLQSMGGSPSASQPSSQQSKSSIEPNTAPAKTISTNEPSVPSQNQNASLISQGKTLFSTQGCIGCHTINGTGGDIGPNLSDEGSKEVSEEWLMIQIKDPKKHDPSSIMPSFGSLNDEEVKSLVTYLQSLKEGSKSSGQSDPSDDNTDSPATSDSNEVTLPNPSSKVNPSLVAKAAYLVGNPSHGKKLFDKQCMRCHGKDGKDNVPNPGSDDGTVPPLNPIDRTIYNSNPVTFAENIDRFIQHGSTPEGPNPQKSMPAFGDDLKLTQQMIAEIQAYVLKLNKVNRAKIMHPGIEPYAFFAMTIGGYAIAGFIILMLGMKLDKGSFNDQKSKISKSPEDEIEPFEKQTESKYLSEKVETFKSAAIHKQKEKSDNSQTSSTAFVIIVIIVVVIIATAVMLIFSSFVTSKPIPSVTTQQISSNQENQPESNSQNNGQSANDQLKENEE
jgi:ubiquinol-cytochrome c reductase cytochrome b subunit